MAHPWRGGATRSGETGRQGLPARMLATTWTSLTCLSPPGRAGAATPRRQARQRAWDDPTQWMPQAAQGAGRGGRGVQRLLLLLLLLLLILLLLLRTSPLHRHGVCCSSSECLFQSIRNFIVNAFPGRPEITAAWANDGNGKKRSYTARSTSRWCENLTKQPPEHNNNNVYFVIGVSGARQLCYCRCDTTEGRREGKCSEFKSRPRLMDGGLYSLLFPGAGPPPAPKKKKQGDGGEQQGGGEQQQQAAPRPPSPPPRNVAPGVSGRSLSAIKKVDRILQLLPRPAPGGGGGGG
eukprot:tig00000681_g3093.t1